MGRKMLVDDRSELRAQGLIPARVWGLFELMHIAEEEIAAAEPDKGWPGTKREEYRERVHNSFKLMCPSPALRDKVPELYRAHVSELLFRVGTRQDTRPGTKAEVLAALSDASTIAPPGQQFAALMERLMFDCGFRLEGEAVREPWVGASSEMLEDCRRKMTVADRVM